MALIDCAEQGYVYHVININDLEKTLQEGIKFNDKGTYLGKYIDFHNYFDLFKPGSIPPWVERKKAIYASICFKEGHCWHSHSAILKLGIQPDRCWVCNENLANIIYEPFILQNIKGFEEAREYIRLHGRSYVEKYWNNSVSYVENLERRYDRMEGYDAEILVMHPIPPEKIQCLYIVSDHRIMSYEQWKHYFSKDNPQLLAQYSRYLQPDNISSDWNTSGSQ